MPPPERELRGFARRVKQFLYGRQEALCENPILEQRVLMQYPRDIFLGIVKLIMYLLEIIIIQADVIYIIGWARILRDFLLEEIGLTFQ